MTTLTRTRPDETTFSTALTLRIVLALALSAASGVMLLLAFPPYGVWPLIWIGFIPALIAQYRVLPLRWARLAPAVAMGVWLTPFLARLFGAEAPFVLKYLGVIIAALIFLTRSERAFHERTHYRWFALQGALDWVGFELIRSFIPVMATAAFVGNTLATQAWLIQPVSIFTIYGLDLVIVLFNFTLAQGIMLLIDRVRPVADAVPVDPRQTLRWVGGVVALTVVWVAVSAILLVTAPAGGATIRAATLQPDLTMPGQFADEAAQVERLAILSEQAREAAAQGAELIVMPELAFGFDPQVEHTDEFRALAAETGAYLYIPYGFSVDEGWRNEAVLLTPDGTFEGVYGKNHVFPGEPRIITAGVYPVNETAIGELGAVICHDGNFTDTPRKVARNGAQILAIPTFESSGWGEHQWQHAVMRAVENRVSVVMAGTAYSSILVDPQGRILDLVVTPQGSEQVLVADVPLGTGRTFIQRMGDWMGWLALAGMIGFMVYMGRSKPPRD